MKFEDLQLIQWPQGYRRKIQKVAEAEGLSVNEWLVKKVSEELEIPAREEMLGKATGTTPKEYSGRTDTGHGTRSSHLASMFRRFKSWIGRRRSVFREPVDKYLEHPQLVEITIPLHGGETRRFSAVAKLQGGTKRSVMAEFPEETLPPGKKIDTSKQGLVTFKLSGPPVFMPVTIKTVPNRKRLFLKDKGFVSASVERRTALRIKASFALEYKRQTQHGFRQSQSIDINTKGVKFQCRDALEIGEILVLNIKLPRPEPYLVLCNARVVWSKEMSESTQTAGCQFLDLSEQDQDAIADFCLREILRLEQA